MGGTLADPEFSEWGRFLWTDPRTSRKQSSRRCRWRRNRPPSRSRRCRAAHRPQSSDEKEDGGFSWNTKQTCCQRITLDVYISIYIYIYIYIYIIHIYICIHMYYSSACGYTHPPGNQNHPPRRVVCMCGTFKSVLSFFPNHSILAFLDMHFRKTVSSPLNHLGI